MATSMRSKARYAHCRRTNTPHSLVHTTSSTNRQFQKLHTNGVQVTLVPTTLHAESKACAARRATKILIAYKKHTMTPPEDMKKLGSKKPTTAKVVDLEPHIASPSVQKSGCVIVPVHKPVVAVPAPSDHDIVHAAKVSPAPVAAPASVHAHTKAAVDAHTKAVVDAHTKAAVDAHTKAAVDAHTKAAVDAHTKAVVNAHAKAAVNAHAKAAVVAAIHAKAANDAVAKTASVHATPHVAKSTDALKSALGSTKKMVQSTKHELATTKPAATAPAVKDAIAHKKVADTIKKIADKTGDKQIAEDADKTGHECDAMLIKYANPNILGEKLVKTDKQQCVGFASINEDLMVAKCPIQADGTCPTQLHAKCTLHAINVDDMWKDIMGGKSALAALGL